MRLLSYNIHKGIGGRDRRYSLDRIIAVIDTEQPDIICLQEVDRHVSRSGHHNQPQMFVEHFAPADHLYQMNVRVQQGGYGNLLLSRWPLVAQHQISLTLRRCKPRGAQLAVIQSPAGPLQIINWHLGLRERERHWQVRRVLEHHLFQESGRLPTLITGDFNDWRNTLGNGPFAIHEFRQITTPISRFRSFPAYMPLGSLDKAFIRGGINVQHVRVAKRKPARDASDHLPLIIDFELVAGL
ncbi:MAG: endonuclease/exonuclease/phosphatase family protein [Planctomycetaceae bacterium]